MNFKTGLGIVLIIAGTLALVYQGVSYTTTEEVADIGPLEVESETTETVPLPPIVGGIGVLVGIGLVVLGARGNDRRRTS